MNQTKPEVNTITVNDLRISFIQFMPALALLQSRQPPNIPCQFLLGAVPFQEEFAKAKADGGLLRSPWRDGYGKLFWARYLPNETRRKEDIWQAQVPFEYDLAQHIKSLSLANGNVVDVRTYLYPWGLGVIVDVGFEGPMPLFDAVDRAYEIRNEAKLQWQFDTMSGNAPLNGLIHAIFERLRAAVYGANVVAEELLERFSVVTVTDATGVSSTDPIVQDSPIHRALEAMAGWNPLWKKMALDPLAKNPISIRQSPLGHIIHGKSLGRVVWFPEDFPSGGAKRSTLSCFHQNLSVASLHVTSLCRIARDAALQWREKKSFASFSVTYRECARLAAGILGRLHGRKKDDDASEKPETYRSGSIRTQIQLYKNDINTARLQLVKPPTELDA